MRVSICINNGSDDLYDCERTNHQIIPQALVSILRFYVEQDPVIDRVVITELIDELSIFSAFDQ